MTEVTSSASAPTKNICCVGDDDQSIYGWRGAEVDNILRFEHDFPGAKVIRLERNYRSTGHILSAASHLIAHNEGRLGKTLRTEDVDGEKVTVTGAWDSEEEARAIGEEIEELQRAAGFLGALGPESAALHTRHATLLAESSRHTRRLGVLASAENALDAEHAALRTKWFGVASVETPYARLLGMGLLIAAALGALLFLWNLMLRRRVAARTATLNQALEDLRKAHGEAEEARGSLAATLEAIPDLLFEFDGAGQCLNIFSNRRNRSIAPREHLIGRTIADVLPAEANVPSS